MGNLYSILNSAAQSLQAFEQAIDVTQNNVTNANSPGYADQVPQLISQDYQSDTGINTGGVQEVTQDTRSTYADTAVQQQLSLQGMYQQLQTTLAPLQTVFDVSSSSAIPSALNQLFSESRTEYVARMDADDISELIENQLIDYSRVTLPNCGGITEFMKLAAICETHNVGLIPHFTGPIAEAALVQNALHSFDIYYMLECCSY